MHDMWASLGSSQSLSVMLSSRCHPFVFLTCSATCSNCTVFRENMDTEAELAEKESMMICTRTACDLLAPSEPFY